MAKTSDPYSSKRLFGRMWRDYLRKHWVWVIVAAVLLLIEGSTLGALSWMLKPLFDKVFVQGESDLIWWVGLGIFLLFVIRAVTSVGSRAVMTNVALRTSSDMQVDLFRHMLRLDQHFYQNNPPGALIERVQGDTAAVQNVWKIFITGTGRDLMALVSLFAVAVSIDPVWTLGALIGAPLLILPVGMAQRYIRRKTRKMREHSSDRATRLDEVFHGIAAVKLNGIEDYQAGRFERLVDEVRNAQIKTTVISGLVPAMIDIITGLGFFVVLVLGGQQIMAGERSVGDFMSFFTAMALTFQPVRRLANTAGSWQTAAASLERLYRLFDTQPTIASPAQPALLPASTRIALEDVHLRYGDKEVLRGLSFTAEPGQTTALVGPSGAGKTTVFNLLTRMVDPDSGRVTLGGTSLADLDLTQLRRQFSTVSQDAALFDETIRENVLLGRADVAAETLREALEAAHVTEFTDLMSDGIETASGPRGSALSGGQRQRVAIARAVLRNAPILLLDEATSALDTVSEAKVAEALAELSQGRTTLVIAHRLSTVRNADKIVVVVEGQVVEQGTHDNLVAKGGVYAGLCRMQLLD
ncbi:ABC transporter ATP-binding protein [Thioclava sp. L04-15]|uniref:ABC transporter ATP-binding protein n=1 Tax=Thioclava sp. L04-15 TaxID=1915318 RepID=UPI000997B3BB|nr:ABC transporter ATP-binding protein [Thioclava sp. L04-15]OOY26829.1 ABC transporter ATP-binding protein [Thioclava sp. L04-15]